MLKPWYKSTAILGAIVSGIGYLARPDVLAVLPKQAAQIVTVVGGILAVFGVRRAIPDATAFQTDTGAVLIHDPSGVLIKDLAAPRNQWGETPAQEEKRRAIMDAEGAELRRTLEARDSRPRGGG